MSTVQTPASQVRPPASYLALGMAVFAAIVAMLALAWVLARGEEDTGVIQGSGVAAVETRDVAPFRAVVLSGANEISIGVGGERLVVVRGDDNLVGMVRSEVQGDALVVDQTGSFETVTPMTVEITVPSLDEVRLVGSGTIQIDGHELGSLAVALPGSGRITGAGSVGTLLVDVSGSGEVDFAELVARDVAVDLSGSGAVLVYATGALDADISGAGSVTYQGDPDRVDQVISGAGSVTGG